MSQKVWLPHITNEITIGSRNRLCAYLIALEGWRRGLKLTWYSKKVKNGRVHAPGRYFSLSSSENTHYFYKSKGDLTSDEAQRITGNKELTKNWLSKAGIPIPEGRMFTEKDSDQKIIQYANELGYPLVLKPTNGYQGIGVFANLKNEEEFSKALKHLRNDMNYTNVIVERYISGTEYRIFVIGDRVIGAVEKIPPSIIGDGHSTIKQLIKNKNKEKKKNPHLFKKPIKIDFEVENCIVAEGYTLESILENGKKIYLRKKNSLSSGGDPVDATDKISEQTKNTTINALKAVPNLAQAGIDVIVDDETSQANIIEINAIAMIGSHIFPEAGQARDIPSAIIDYYFPESISEKRYNSNVYFDLQNLLEPLINKTASQVEVTPAPFWDNMHAKKYIIEGKVQKVGYRKWVRRKALENDLFGYAQNLNDGTVVVVVAGPEENVKSFKNICKVGPKKANVKNVKEEPWINPIKVGFEIKDNPKSEKSSNKTMPSSKKSKIFKITNRIKRYLVNKN